MITRYGKTMQIRAINRNLEPIRTLIKGKKVPKFKGTDIIKKPIL